MSDEKKYRVELTPTQICELMDWHRSHVDKYRRMGVKKDYLKIHENDNLAVFIKKTYDLMRLDEAMDGECDPHTSPQEKA